MGYMTGGLLIFYPLSIRSVRFSFRSIIYSHACKKLEANRAIDGDDLTVNYADNKISVKSIQIICFCLLNWPIAINLIVWRNMDVSCERAVCYNLHEVFHSHERYVTVIQRHVHWIKHWVFCNMNCCNE